jgi:hypothetical protein
VARSTRTLGLRQLGVLAAICVCALAAIAAALSTGHDLARTATAPLLAVGRTCRASEDSYRGQTKAVRLIRCHRQRGQPYPACPPGIHTGPLVPNHSRTVMLMMGALLGTINGPAPETPCVAVVPAAN